MLIVTSNVLVVPLALTTMLIEAYILVAATRLILGRVPGSTAARARDALARITDPLVGTVATRLNHWRGRPVAPWVPWLVVLSAGMVAKCGLIRLMIACA